MSYQIGKFELDEAGVAEAMRATSLKTELGQLAIKLATIVRSTGPKGSSGEYRKSIKIGKVNNERLETWISVGSDDPFAHLVEFGSVNNKPYRPLSRAGEQLGLTLEDFGRGGSPR